MNTVRIRQELVAIKEQHLALVRRVDEVLDELGRAENDAAVASPWMKPKDLAAAVGLSAKTISRYITEAKPAKGEHPFASGEGRRLRVHRERFETWRSSR